MVCWEVKSIVQYFACYLYFICYYGKRSGKLKSKLRKQKTKKKTPLERNLQTNVGISWGTFVVDQSHDQILERHLHVCSVNVMYVLLWYIDQILFMNCFYVLLRFTRSHTEFGLRLRDVLEEMSLLLLNIDQSSPANVFIILWRFCLAEVLVDVDGNLMKLLSS